VPSNVPKARAIIAGVVADLETAVFRVDREHVCKQLERALSYMGRDPPARKAEPTCRPVTAELARRIRDFADDNPGMSLQAIAEHFKVNSGRVSEAINHLR
jgi:hypothetical protein